MNAIALRDEDLLILRNALARFPSVREFRVFCSRATGNACGASDLDLAISAPNATAEDGRTSLGRLSRAPIIYELDLVRLDQTQTRVARKDRSLKSTREGMKAMGQQRGSETWSRSRWWIAFNEE